MHTLRRSNPSRKLWRKYRSLRPLVTLMWSLAMFYKKSKSWIMALWSSKERIAPNKDQDKDNLKTDSSTCPPVVIRILLSLCNILKWSIAKVDAKSAFLQTGAATLELYVIPPRECSDRSKYWLLLTAAYGLVNANVNWQESSDNFLRCIKFEQLVYVPQLFYMKKDSSLQILAVKLLTTSHLLVHSRYYAPWLTTRRIHTSLGLLFMALGHSISVAWALRNMRTTQFLSMMMRS